MGGILGNDTDMVQSGIDTVGQCKIDDTAVTAEIKCGFGTFIRQLVKARTPASRQDEDKRVFGKSVFAGNLGKIIIHSELHSLLSRLRANLVPQIHAESETSFAVSAAAVCVS